MKSILFMGMMLLVSPFMLGVINRTKAFFGGRAGSPLLQLYHDLFKLLKKGAVYSRTTTWIFRAGPLVTIASLFSAALLVSFGGVPTLVHFPGDFILFVYLLGLARFFTVLAALDTGSSFEGMGASREVTFSTLAEPVLLLNFLALARQVRGISLSDIYPGLSSLWSAAAPSLILVAVSLFVILLAENSRIPIDDPNTHLELTMIHEVMVLDHSGPDLAMILYGSALKLWLFSALLLGVIMPVTFAGWVTVIYFICGMTAIAVMVGMVESIMARLRLTRIPALLIGAAACALFSLLLGLRGTA